MARGRDADIRELILRFTAQTELARREMRDLAAGVDRDTRRMDRDLRRVDDAADRLGRSFRRAGGLITGAIGVVGIGAAAREMLGYAEAAKKLEAQLRLATAQTGNFGQAQQDVRRIAGETRADINEIGRLYSAFMRSSAELGISQAQAARAVQTVSQAFTISGASAEESGNAIRQLMQAFQSGVLRGDEFNSMMENAPRLAQLLADSMGRPVSSLRGLAEAGELTADKLTRAFTDQRFTEALDREFRSMPVTFDQAMTLVKNSAQETFGAFDQGGGFSAALASFFTSGADGFDDLASEAEEFGILVRSTMAGLGNVFEPLTNAGVDAFNQLISGSDGLGDSLQGLVRIVDHLIGLLGEVPTPLSMIVTAAQGLGMLGQGDGQSQSWSESFPSGLSALLDIGQLANDYLPEREGGVEQRFRQGFLPMQTVLEAAREARRRATTQGQNASSSTRRTPRRQTDAGGTRTRQNDNWRSREDAIRWLGQTLEADGFRVGENNAFGGVRGSHPGMGNAAHGRYAIDVNAIAGNDASNPEARARLDAAALQAQRRGFRVLWNGQVYEPGGTGPTRAIPRGQNQHTNHGHFEAPQSILQENRQEFDAARAAEQAWRREQRFANELEQAQNRLIQARGDLITSAEERAQFEIATIETERQAEARRIESDMIQGEITEAQAEQLRLLNDATAAARRERSEREEAERIRVEALDLRQSDLRNEMDLQAASAALLETRQDQRAAALRMLDLQIEAERIELEGVIASRDATEAQKEIARRRLAILGGLRESAARGIDRQHESPTQRYRRELEQGIANIDDRLEELSIDTIENLNSELASAATEALGLSGALGEVVESLIRMGLEWAALQLLGAFGGGAGLGGGGIGSGIAAGANAVTSWIGGFRESGGPVKAGMAYIVGEKRPELFVPKVDGMIIPRVPQIRVPQPTGNMAGVTVTYAPVINAPNADAAQLRQVRAELEAQRKAFPGQVVQIVQDAIARRTVR